MPIDMTRSETLRDKLESSIAIVPREEFHRRARQVAVSLHRRRVAATPDENANGNREYAQYGSSLESVGDYSLTHLRMRLSPKSLVMETTDRIRFGRVVVAVPKSKLGESLESRECFIQAEQVDELIAYLSDKKLPQFVRVVIRDRGLEVQLPKSAETLLRPRQFASEFRNVVRYPDLRAFVFDPANAIAACSVSASALGKLLNKTYNLIRRLNPKDGKSVV